MTKKIIQKIKRHPFLFSLIKSVYLFFTSMCSVIRQLSSYPKWKKISRAEIVKLELGSGSKKGINGWTTVDLVGADIIYNLRNGIPLKDNSVDAIYTSHMFEHIPYKSLVVFIRECKRVLKINGSLSVCVPNAGHYIKAYSQKSNFSDPRTLYQPAIVDTGSYLDQVNYIAYMDGQHAYLFDEENLVNTIKKGGFSNVKIRGFDASTDLLERDHESIYAYAIKQ
jgi:predicted SAM-dependent methyltransferase